MAVLNSTGRPAGIVGRHDALAALEDRVAHGGAVLVSGEAGIGKTRLVEHGLGRVAADGATVLVGHGIAVGGEPLRLAALAGLVRAGAGRDPEGPGPVAPSLVGAGPDALLEHLWHLVETATPERRIVLVAEDVQWADRATCEVLLVLARQVAARPAALVMTVRDDGVPRGHHVREFRAELLRTELVTPIALSRLGAADTATLIERRLGPVDPAVAATIHRRSDGNPLLVEELCHAHVAGGDRRRRIAALIVRTEALSPLATAVVHAVAAAGQAVDDALLPAVLDAGEAAVADALREAVDAQVIVSGDGMVAFRHAPVADAVRDDLLTSERRLLHRRWAEVLAARGAEPTVLAHHWAEAGRSEQALAASVAAGDAALADLAVPDAVRHFRRALRLWDAVEEPARLAGCPKAELAARAAEAANWAGDPAAAEALVRVALDQPLEPATRAGLLERAAWYALRRGAVDRAAAAYDRALDALPADAPPRLRAAVLAGSVRISEHRHDSVTASARAAEAVRAADRCGAAAERAQAHNMAARAGLLRGDIDGAAKHLDVACAEAEHGGDVVLLAVALGDRADLQVRAGQVGPAIADLTAAADRLRAAGRRHPHALVVDSVAGGLHRRLGHRAEARRLAEAVLAEARTSPTRAAGHLLAGLCDLDEGALGDARERLELARFGAAPLLVSGIAGPLALGRAELALVEGRFDDARSAVEEGIGQIERTADEELLGHLGLLGLRIVAERERHAGTRLSARLLTRGRREIARYESLLDRVLAGPGARRVELAAAWRAERHRDDPARWEESARAWAATAWPRAAATARLRAAEARLARPEDRAAGTSALAEIRAGAEADGWRLLVDHVDDVARRAGVTATGPGSSPRVPAGRLTRRERAVLDLVAAGATNRQIAATLYISPKTASVHVSRILTKLGAVSRDEAVALVRRIA